MTMVTNFTRAFPKTICAMGDSLTEPGGFWGVSAYKMWPEQLAGLLRADGVAIKARNFGIGGDTTTMMLARYPVMYEKEIPDLAIIFGGVNDPGAPIVGAVTQSNITTMGEGLFTAGVERLVILNTQYKNFTTGGDTVGTPEATYATLRTFQLAAANALIAAHPGQVAYCDVYAYMRALIGGSIVYNGVTYNIAQGDNQWHALADNQHLNELGAHIVAKAVYATLQANPLWLTALAA